MSWRADAAETQPMLVISDDTRVAPRTGNITVATMPVQGAAGARAPDTHIVVPEGWHTISPRILEKLFWDHVWPRVNLVELVDAHSKKMTVRRFVRPLLSSNSQSVYDILFKIGRISTPFADMRNILTFQFKTAYLRSYEHREANDCANMSGSMSTLTRVDSSTKTNIIHGDGPWEMIACLTVCGFLNFVADHSIADIMQKRVYGLYENTGSGLQTVPRFNQRNVITMGKPDLDRE